MAFVVTEDCIACKHMECAEACPVDCFHEGENMLVIHPDECIDCGVCARVCPIDAIVSDIGNFDLGDWVAFNRKYAEIWPRITARGTPPANGRQMQGVPNKRRDLFSEKSGEGTR